MEASRPEDDANSSSTYLVPSPASRQDVTRACASWGRPRRAVYTAEVGEKRRLERYALKAMAVFPSFDRSATKPRSAPRCSPDKVARD